LSTAIFYGLQVATFQRQPADKIKKGQFLRNIMKGADFVNHPRAAVVNHWDFS